MARPTDSQRDWRRRQRAALRWSLWGLLPGMLLALLAFAPAAWFVPWLAEASGQRLLLAEARGTLWQGSAVPVLTGGAGSMDASALPGRLHWSLGIAGGAPVALALRLRHDCCLDGELALRVEPGWGRLRLLLPQRPQALGRWPAAWLEGLGTPWNTIKLAGEMSLASDGLVLEWAAGRLQVGGRATLELHGISSRLSTLDTLGSYRLLLAGGAAAAPPPQPVPPGSAALTLSTLDGALQLSGSGQWSPAGLRFRGEARAAPGSESVLNNLLNVVGRRQGALALLSIG